MFLKTHTPIRPEHNINYSLERIMGATKAGLGVVAEVAAAASPPAAAKPSPPDTARFMGLLSHEEGRRYTVTTGTERQQQKDEHNELQCALGLCV